VKAELNHAVEQDRQRLIEITQQLVRRPSENKPPHGAELACQSWIAEQLRACGWEPDLYPLDSVAGLREHPLFFAGRDYAGRPNIGARKQGTGNGRSLLLSGHIDTVPRGTQPWTRDPFGGAIEGNRLYGRGANDMKAGVATNLFVVEMLAKLGIELAGDLLFETVADEEFGGSNGTLAGRLRGYNADAVVLSEPTSLRLCPAQRGGRIQHIQFEAPGGVLQNGKFPQGVIPQLTRFLERVPEFAEQRKRTAPHHELFHTFVDPVPVSVTKVVTSPWGTSEPITVPETALIEFYWQTMPGETREAIDREFSSWLEGMVREEPEVFVRMPRFRSPVRWLPGSAIARNEPLVLAFQQCAAAVLGREPEVCGIEGPCDLFVFQQGFGIPGILWGAHGGNTHAADEYVEIDTLVEAARVLLHFVVEWCGATA
jgi:acetylornithine deacetylase